MKSWIIGPQNTAVEIGIQCVFLLDRSRMGIANNPDGEYVNTRLQNICDVCAAPNECSFNTIDTFSIQENIGFPVDSIEVEQHTAPFRQCGEPKFAAIPEVGIEISIGYLQQIIGIIGVRESANVHVRSLHRSRYRGLNPTARVVIQSRNLLARRCHLR